MKGLVLWAVLLTPRPECIKADADANNVSFVVMGTTQTVSMRRPGTPPPPVGDMKILLTREDDPPFIDPALLVCFEVEAVKVDGSASCVGEDGKLRLSPCPKPKKTAAKSEPKGK